MDMNAYLSMFIDESNDHLQSLNENLLQLENSPENIEIVQSIFRSAHTLKGMAATMGYEDLASLTHEMENVLDLVRNSKLQMDGFIFDTLFQGLDALESMVSDITNGGSGKGEVTHINDALRTILQTDYKYKDNAANPAETAVVASEIEEEDNNAVSSSSLDPYQATILLQSIEMGHQVYYIRVQLSSSCLLKGVRAYMIFELLERIGEVIQSYPSVQDLEQERFEHTFSVFVISKLEQADLQQQLLNISEVEQVEVVLLDAESVDTMMQTAVTVQTSIAEASIEKNQSTTPVNQQSTKSQNTAVSTTNSDKTATAMAIQKKDTVSKETTKSTNGSQVVTRTIRVDIDRLDSLMNLFSELLIDRVRLEQLASEINRSDLQETVEHMARVSTDLQNIVLKLRMVPVETVFSRFPRMVRDLARNLNKKIELVITGAETELDRTVIDEIGDPLVHLLRNSIDHGIESIEERLAAGKPEVGTIELRAFHSGNHVFIEVEEDGRGINTEKVKQTAIKRNIITVDEAAKLSVEEIHMLIFAPGFSTADIVSDVSGRGVGLDVVRSKISSLSGDVTIVSEQGKGTKFSVQLPLTLSIISAMLIKMGTEKYALPLSSIMETAIVNRQQIKQIHGQPMIDFRGAIIPLVSLSKVLQCPNYDETAEEEHEVVIIRKGDKIAAVVIDEFIGQSEIVLKTLGNYLANIPAVSGATILGDGYVALIIDTNALIK
ncbi:chemotaxis protein CheW [Paenibacillus yanchengensis]|uniref:Chemotaxis protein CheA n=1 Tax=Paenibacillus yanchengensis TaxID=2035833 RepID=A0ABW4YMW2_9BACL